MTFTPSPTKMVTPTARTWPTPKVTATALTATINTDGELESLIEQIYPFCIGQLNDANSSALYAPSHLQFIKSEILLDPEKIWISEVADNLDDTLQAFVACEVELCHPQIYVRKSATGEVYEIDWEFRMPWRPINQIIWINNDLLAFYQSANPYAGTIKVISFSKKEYLFSAMVFPDEYCLMPTAYP